MKEFGYIDYVFGLCVYNCIFKGDLILWLFEEKVKNIEKMLVNFLNGFGLVFKMYGVVGKGWCIIDIYM